MPDHKGEPSERIRPRFGVRFVTLAGLALSLVVSPGLVAPAHAAGVPAALAAQFAAGGPLITLDDDYVVTASDPSLAVPAGTSVTLDLNGRSLTVTGAPAKAGISVDPTTTFTVRDSVGGGRLTATGGIVSAGIGGNSGMPGGTVVILSGSVTATGGHNGAGIGGGGSGSGGLIDIKGGTVVATGQTAGAGLGGGYRGAGGTVRISGGTVVATGSKGSSGIGGGMTGAGATVVIDGGTVRAIAGQDGAAIGGGGPQLGGLPAGAGGSLTIGTAGTVTVATAFGTVIGQGQGHPWTVDPSALTAAGFGSLTNAGTLTIESSTLALPADSEVTNSGSLVVNGAINSLGTIVNSGVIAGSGSIQNGGAITSAGTVDESGGLAVTVNNYLVSFDASGGSAIDDMRIHAVTFDAADAALPTPIRLGHTFQGWYSATDPTGPEVTETTVLGSGGVPASLALLATWSLDVHTVTFDSQGGDAVPSATTDYGTTIATPAAPTRPGYTFTGWYTSTSGGTAWDFGTAVTGDLVLYAAWEPVVVAAPVDPGTPGGSTPDPGGSTPGGSTPDPGTPGTPGGTTPEDGTPIDGEDKTNPSADSPGRLAATGADTALFPIAVVLLTMGGVLFAMRRTERPWKQRLR